MKTDDRNSTEGKPNFVPNHSGRALGGLVLVLFGSLLLANRLHVLDIPPRLFWDFMMIGLGIFLGARKSFRFGIWIIPILIGSGFILDYYFPEFSMRDYGWPVLIIVFGVYMILKPRRKKNWGSDWEKWATQSTDSDNMIDSTNVFGGSKRKVVSKDFKGGEITSMFGGSDIDLMQADINGKATLDITNVFGGTKLLVPANWKVKSELVCIFGGVDDKRPQSNDVSDNRMLLLTGTVIFGGVDIKSY